MGIDISKIENQQLKALAYQLDDGNNVLEGNEITIFKEKAPSAEGYTAEAFNQVMGLNITTNPIKSQEPTKAEKKEKKAYENQVKDEVKEMVKTLSPDELMPALRNKFSNPVYAEVIADVEKLLNAVNATNYNSKEDVEKIKDKVKKNTEFKDMTGFQKNVLDSLVKQAKDEQIVKETDELYEMYDSIKKEAPEADKNNVEKLLKQVKNQIKDKKSYYKKEAFKELKNIIAKEVRKDQTGRLSETEGTSSKKVQNELLEGVAKDDKFTRKVVKKQMKTEREIAGRHNKFEDRKEDLTHITEKDLKKKLGDDLFLKLNASFLADKKNPNGTFNVSALSDAVLYRVGYDYELNRSKDTEMSELRNLSVELKELTGQDLSEKEVKKIVDLVGVKKEGRRHNIGKALLDGIIPGIAGATGALLASGKLDVTQKVSLKVNDEATAQEMYSQLAAAGASPQMSQNASGLFTINILQKVLRDDRVLNTIAGFGIGYLQGAAMSLLIGEDIAFEKSCISISDFDIKEGRYTDINKFEEYIRARYPEKKADTVMLVAKTFVDKKGRFDLLGFQSKLNEIAGVGSNANCKEMTGARIYQKDEEPVIPHNNDNNDNNDEEVCNAKVKNESTPERDSDPVDTTCTLNNPARYYWDEIADAYYPGLRSEHPNDWSRILKKALAYNNEGNFDQNLYEQLLAGKSVETLDLPDEIEGYKRKSCENGHKQLEAFRAQRNGKARKGDVGGRKGSIDRAGRRSSRTTKIPGTNQWRATDCCTGEYAIGSTREEAVANLKAKTGKNYGNVFDEQ